eukprot:gene21564-8282_t
MSRPTPSYMLDAPAPPMFQYVGCIRTPPFLTLRCPFPFLLLIVLIRFGGAHMPDSNYKGVTHFARPHLGKTNAECTYCKISVRDRNGQDRNRDWAHAEEITHAKAVQDASRQSMANSPGVQTSSTAVSTVPGVTMPTVPGVTMPTVPGVT